MGIKSYPTVISAEVDYKRMVAFGFKKSSGTVVGIELTDSGIALAVKSRPGVDAAISHLGFIDSTQNEQGPGESQTLLAKFIEDKHLKGSNCHVVLASSDYQMLLAEAPDVPDEELRDAIRWRIKDLISQPIDKMAVDVFRLPNDSVRAGKNMAYVIAAENKRIKTTIALIADLQLKLVSIDIGEMALRNLSLLTEEGQSGGRGVGIVRVREGGGTVSLYRNGNMYLSRQFKVHYNAGLLDELPEDEIALEIQRSLDYYERQMGLSPPQALYFCGESLQADKLTDTLRRALPLPVKFLELSNLQAPSEEGDGALLQTCIGALGASMRDEVAA